MTILSFCMTHQNGRTPNTFFRLKIGNLWDLCRPKLWQKKKIKGKPKLAPHATHITLFVLSCFNLCVWLLYIENCRHCSNHLKFELSVKEQEQWLTGATLDQLACLPDPILPLSKSKRSFTSSENGRHHPHQHWGQYTMASLEWKSCTNAWMSFLVCSPPNKPSPTINMRNGLKNCWMDL